MSESCWVLERHTVLSGAVLRIVPPYSLCPIIEDSNKYETARASCKLV